MYSQNALQLIREFNPDARILVFFCNLVDFVQSLHAQFAYNKGRKPDFPALWSDPEKRSRFIAFGSFGEQFKRLTDLFPSEQIHVSFLEDVRSNPRQEYLRALDFLGLQDDGRIDFSTFNAHKVHRFPWMARFAKQTPKPIEASWQCVKRLTGIKKVGLMERVSRLNTKPVQRKGIDPDLRESIYKAFGMACGTCHSRRSGGCWNQRNCASVFAGG